MRIKKSAAAFALFVFLAAAPSFAGMVDRERGKDPSVIDRVVQLIKRIVRPLDVISIPRP